MQHPFVRYFISEGMYPILNGTLHKDLRMYFHNILTLTLLVSAIVNNKARNSWLSYAKVGGYAEVGGVYSLQGGAYIYIGLVTKHIMTIMSMSGTIYLKLNCNLYAGK